jgi:hypothetical protein
VEPSAVVSGGCSRRLAYPGTMATSEENTVAIVELARAIGLLGITLDRLIDAGGLLPKERAHCRETLNKAMEQLEKVGASVRKG